MAGGYVLWIARPACGSQAGCHCLAGRPAQADVEGTAGLGRRCRCRPARKGPCRRRSCFDLDVEPGRGHRDVPRLRARGPCLQSVAASHVHVCRDRPAARETERACAADRARLGRGSRPGRLRCDACGRILAQGGLHAGELAGRGSECQPRGDDPDSVVYLAFTSGTTGTPKCVMHSHNTLLANARDMVRDWGHGPDTVLLSLSPLSHHIAWVGVAQWLVAGCRFVTNDPPAGVSVLDWIIETGATYVMGVPTHAMDVLAQQKARGLERLGRVARILHGGRADPAVGGGRVRGAGHQAAEHLRHDGELLAPVHASGRRNGHQRHHLRPRRPGLRGAPVRSGRPGPAGGAGRGGRDRRARRRAHARLLRQPDGHRDELQSRRLVHVGRSRLHGRAAAISRWKAA